MRLIFSLIQFITGFMCFENAIKTVFVRAWALSTSETQEIFLGFTALLPALWTMDGFLSAWCQLPAWILGPSPRFLQLERPLFIFCPILCLRKATVLHLGKALGPWKGFLSSLSYSQSCTSGSCTWGRCCRPQGNSLDSVLPFALGLWLCTWGRPVWKLWHMGGSTLALWPGFSEF